MEEKEKFELEFTLEEIHFVMMGLRKLPYENAEPVLKNIVSQYNNILKEKEAAAKESSE
jgi:hypothetical protein